jgi:hypothetical protein
MKAIDFLRKDTEANAILWTKNGGIAQAIVTIL